MIRISSKILYIVILVVLSANRLPAQYFHFYPWPDGDATYDSLTQRYHSNIILKEGERDSIFYLIDVPDSTQGDVTVTAELRGSSNFLFGRDTMGTLSLNTRITIPIQKFFANPLLVGWTAHNSPDTAFLLAWTNTDTVIVQIIGRIPKDPPDIDGKIMLLPEGSWWKQPGFLAFDSVPSGTKFCKDFQLHNFSGNTIHITDFRLHGYSDGENGYKQEENFTATPATGLPVTILNGDSIVIQICYTPPSIEEDSDSLQVISNDSVLVVFILNGSSTEKNDVAIRSTRAPALYPNPVSSHFRITGTAEDQPSIIEDAIGRIVFDGIIHSQQMDMSNFMPGQYTLVLQNGERITFIKINP